MPRSKITSTSKDAIADDGNTLFSMISGEQTVLDVTINWLTNLSGYTCHAKVIEAVNDTSGTRPTQVQTGGVETNLAVLQVGSDNALSVVPLDSDGVATFASDYASNQFKIVLPHDLVTAGSGWTVRPTPGNAVYGFIALELSEPISVNAAFRQTWRPLRGQVEVLYSIIDA